MVTNALPPVDALVVGGGAAGMAAALVLGRSRRSVLVVDAGEPRNGPSPSVHSFLTRDGTPPGVLADAARTEVEGYGVEVRTGRAVGVQRSGTTFVVTLDDHTQVRARRLVLATGIVDELPDVPGLADHWGRDVVHCPYCHGWEVRDRRIGVFADSPTALHKVGLFRQLSDDVVLLQHTSPSPTAEQARELSARGVEVIEGEVIEVLGDTGITGVRLDDGRTIAFGALAVSPRFHGRVDLLADLGLTLTDHASGMGTHLVVDMAGRTSAAGVVAAGNLTDPMAQVVAAAAQGNIAGAWVNADLVDEDTRRAVAAATDRDDEHTWNELYAADGDRTPIWSGDPNGTLMGEVADLVPGSVLDVGCGEGGDAIWLAQQGWQVTGLDPSGIALARARAAAQHAGVDVTWLRGGLTGEAAEHLATYDLVSAQYPGLRSTPDGAAVTALLAAVAPGGTLLVVHHEVTGDHRHHAHAHDNGRNGPMFDSVSYVMPAEVAAALGDEWVVEVDEQRRRPDRAEDPHGHVHDLVLRARRR